MIEQSSTHPQLDLTRLPLELLQHIGLTFLGASDLATFALTCKQVRVALLIPRAASFCLSLIKAGIKVELNQSIPGSNQVQKCPLNVIDPTGLGCLLRYDTSNLGVSYFERVFDEQRSWQMPGVRVPSWALPNDNGPQTQFIQGVMREDAQVGSRYVVSRTATSRVPLPIISKYCYKQESAYFEVTFERDGTTVPSPSDFLAVMVGLVSKPHLEKPTHLPAHDSFAVSYESLYGQATLGPHNGEGVLYGPSYSFGDTVGVGIIPYYAPLSNNTAPPPSELLYTDKTPHACTIFFTLNGQFIGDVINRFSSDLLSYEKSLFPAIGFVTSKIPVIAKVNFGLSPFKFQMKSHVSNILKNDPAMQSRVQPQQTIKNHTVLRYLRPSPSDSTTPHQMVINSRGPTHNTTQQTPTIQTLTPTSQRVHFPACPTFHSIQSPTPLRPGTSFRVKILSNTPTDSTFLAIGVALRPYSAYYHVGWDFGSFAYHSDDGKLFDGTGQGGFAWGDPYTVGDVIGCGMLLNGDLYFTRNGERVGPVRTVEGVEVTGVVPAGWFEWRLHPTVSACQEWVVDVEFEEEGL